MRTFSILAFCCLLSAGPIAAQDTGRTDDLERRVSEHLDGLFGRLAIGQQAVLANDSLITLHAATYDLDADWLRAIIMVEAERSEDAGSGRAYPTGINVKWAGLDDSTVETFSDVSENIRLAALLLRRIADRVRDPDQNLGFIASLFDDIGTDGVTPYGRRVEEAYYARIWEVRFRD